MPTHVEAIINAWRAGVDTVDNHSNPAGPLFLGDTTEADLMAAPDFATREFTVTDSCQPRPMCC